MASGLSASTTMQSAKLPGRKQPASPSSFSECAACMVAPASTSTGVIPHWTQARLMASGRLSELLVPGLRSEAIAIGSFASRMASIGRRLAPGIAEDRPGFEGGKHLVHQRAQVGTAVDTGWDDVRAEKGGNHPETRLFGNLAKDLERAGLVLEVEAVAGLGLDRCRAIGDKAVGPGGGQLGQRHNVGVAGCPYRSRDAALARLLRVVGDATHTLREFIRSEG